MGVFDPLSDLLGVLLPDTTYCLSLPALHYTDCYISTRGTCREGETGYIPSSSNAGGGNVLVEGRFLLV